MSICIAHGCHEPPFDGLPFCQACWPLVPAHFRTAIEEAREPRTRDLLGAIDAVRWKREMRARAKTESQ